jgi:ABC-type uncharacterized transport system substrate-binding protein
MQFRRREFITLLGGTAALPLAAHAQQPAISVVGLINPGVPESSTRYVAAFRQGLKEAGLVEGQNVTIEYRWAEGRYGLMPDLVAELLRHGVAVIATPGSTAAALAAKAATRTTPIVFGVAEDPIRLGLVASLAKPDGNATGINFFTAELAAKRLELLREMVTRAARLAVLVNRANAANAESTLREVETAAQAKGLPIRVLNAGTRPEIEVAFATLVHEKVDALFVGGDGFFNSRRVQLPISP